MNDSEKRRELSAQLSQNLTDFLMTDLALGFEFARSAQLYKVSGNTKAFTRNKENATRAVRDIGYFADRLPAKEKAEIERRCSELARLISVL